jgi:tRNA(fMet)-specific endonuclease VapC
MIRLAADTNAAVDLLRKDRREPTQLASATEVFLPLPVLGELLVGAELSDERTENVAAVHAIAREWTLLLPDALTAGFYAHIAAPEFRRFRASPKTEPGRKNDLWIAALVFSMSSLC